MNSNKNINAIGKLKIKSIISIGMHPEGGFVALPGGRTSRIMYDDRMFRRRCNNRKGFVAWPEKE